MLQSGKASCGLRWSWLLDFGDPCQSIDLPEEVRARVRAQQVLAVTRMTPPLMVANIVNACALVIVLRLARQDTVPAGLWAVLVVALALWTLWQGRRRAGPLPKTARPETCHKVVRSAALFGALWAVPGVYVLPDVTGTAQAFTAALLTGMIGGGALALHPIPAAAMVFLVTVTAGGLLGLARTGDPALIGFILIALAFFFVVSRNILRHSEVFVSEFVGKLELEEKSRLVARLLDQTRSAGEPRLRVERRRAQARKMEAIGQLTGGVAHDFNNVLAAIQGHAELIALEGKADPSMVSPIVAATARGSELVRRLLAVAGKQELRPEAVHVGQLIGAMTPSLQSTLGAAIRLETHVEPTIWSAWADRGQLEDAILNLALNARDAMPRGGRLLIDCRNARAPTEGALRRLGVGSGEFVQIAVRDKGRGMTAEVRERALEPFYTTKKFGEGSGLGLSVVFGFVRQSGGQLAIESEPGAGTVVRLFLPRFHCPAEGIGAPPGSVR
jgi:signal transduction histidine kinase